MTFDSFIPLSPRLSLNPAELVFNFIRASGPGGQNVNKVATAVQLRFDAAHSASLPEAVRQRALRLAGKRATIAGEIVITAQRFRTQEANRKDAVERLVELLKAATHVPKKRIAIKVSRSQKRRRVDAKKQRSSVKRNRNATGWD
jgi:ribosome-associated protein